MAGREILILIGICLVWGMHFIVVRLTVAEFPPIFYAAIRMTLVAILMAPFLRWRRGQMKYVLPAGLGLGAINYAALFTGLKYATVSTASLTMELTIPFVTILSIIFLRERIGLPRSIGIALAFIGVAIISLGGHNDAGDGLNMQLGLSLVALAAFAEATGAILIKKTSGVKPFELLAWFALIGALALWPLTFIFEENQAASFANSRKDLLFGAVIYSALGASVFAHSAYYWLLQRLPVTTVAPGILLTPGVAMAGGVFLLGEDFGLRHAIGAGLVLAGVGLVVLRNSRKQAIISNNHEPGGLS